MNLEDVLSEVNENPSSYLQAARLIKNQSYRELLDIKVAVLSTFTAELLEPYMVVASANKGINLILYFGSWNQLDQEILVEDSGLYDFDPDIILIATRIDDMTNGLIDNYVHLDYDQVREQLSVIRERIFSWLEELRSRTTAKILVFNYAQPEFLAAGLGDSMLRLPQSEMVQKANVIVSDACKSISDAYVYDYARTVNESGLEKWLDPRLWYMGRIPFSSRAQLETGNQLARYFKALCLPQCKCLVVDCDDTLWGGILGEEGLGGIQLGEEYPGNVYKDFQKKLLSLKNRGILLALASKNNEKDVMEVFRKHSDSVLRPEDFAAVQIHWNDKSTSLSDIANELEIGTDALAFFDDNPVERDWVRVKMPEVTVIEVPNTPLGYTRALENSGAFDQLIISDEDKVRSKMYQERISRNKFQSQTTNLEDFLDRLDMVATLGLVNSDTIARVSQLLSKTNQFNLTTRRYNASELENMIGNGAIAIWLRLTDRFGDNGLVGVAISKPLQHKIWVIDTFLMSCRVMGRQVERALLSVLSELVIKEGAEKIVGEYIPTDKNGMVDQFYPEQGFAKIDSDVQTWEWSLSSGGIPWPNVIQLNPDSEYKHV